MPATIGPATDRRTKCEYLHDTHVVVDSVYQCVKTLLDMGRVISETSLVYETQPSRWSYDRSVNVHSHHFFDLDGREVAYFIPDMASVVPGLTIFDVPRRWGESIIEEHRKGYIGFYIEQWKRNQEPQG